MKLKSWLENHIYLSKKRTNIRKLVKAEAKTFNASQKDGKNTKREKTFITFPRFYKAQPLVDQTSLTEKEENAWKTKKSSGPIKARKNVITTEFNAHSASTSISSHPNYINYYYTIDDDQSKFSKSWYFATPPSHTYRSETISSDGNVIKNKGAYTKKKLSQVSTPITNEDVNPAPYYTAEKKRCGDFGNFMLPNFSYDSTAICRESNYTGEDRSFEIPYKPETLKRRRMMIRTNPWFDYSRIDTSGYSVSDESFTSNNTHVDNHLSSVYLGAEKRNEKSLKYDECGSLLWTSTLKNQLGNPVACNGDSGFYDDIRDIRGSKFTSLFSNLIPEQASNDDLEEMTSIIDHSYGDREATINFADEGNYYFSINEEDSGCSNTNSWSYRSSEPSSNCGEFNNDTWERSTSVSCERPLKSEKELCSQVLSSRSESHKMSPTSAKNKIINNIMYWDRNHKELLNKLKDYRNKINENKRYLNGKVYADCRRQSHRYQIQSGQDVDTSNVMIYEMDPIIYI